MDDHVEAPDSEMQEPEGWMWLLLFLAPYIGIWFFLSAKYADWRSGFFRTTGGRIVIGLVALVTLVVVGGVVNLASMTPEERAKVAEASKARKAAKAEAAAAKEAHRNIPADPDINDAKMNELCAKVLEFRNAHRSGKNAIAKGQVFTNFREWVKSNYGGMLLSKSFSGVQAKLAKLSATKDGEKAGIFLDFCPGVRGVSVRGYENGIKKGTSVHTALANFGEGEKVKVTGTMKYGGCDEPGLDGTAEKEGRQIVNLLFAGDFDDGDERALKFLENVWLKVELGAIAPGT